MKHRFSLACLAILSFLLLGCSCGALQKSNNDAGADALLPPTATGEPDNRPLMGYIEERTVLVIRDCSPREGVLIVGSDDPDEDFDASGSATIVHSGPEGSFIFTASHVVSIDSTYSRGFSCKISIKQGDDLTIVSTIAKSDDRDMAMLYTKKNLHLNTAFELNTYTGQQIISAGFPHQFADSSKKYFSISAGTLATRYVIVGGDSDENGYYHRVTSPIYFGNSGGGVWSKEGKLIGVVVVLYGVTSPNDATIPYDGYYYIKPIEEIFPIAKEAGQGQAWMP